MPHPHHSMNNTPLHSYRWLQLTTTQLSLVAIGSIIVLLGLAN